MTVKDLEILVGAEVNYVRFSYQVDINFIYGDNKFANLQLEADFELKTENTTTTIDPSNIKSLALVICLLHSKIVRIEISDDYKLSVVFDNGAELHASPIQKYEAWHLTGDDLPYYVAQGV